MAKDPREYGYEGEMAMSQLKGILQHAKQLHDMLKPDTFLSSLYTTNRKRTMSNRQ